MWPVISRAGGDVTSIDVIRVGNESSVRDITVDVQDSVETGVVLAIKSLKGTTLINVSDRTFLAHLGAKYLLDHADQKSR
jgi:malate dehydrogenase (oxaloacetate-decarboxylating)